VGALLDEVFRRHPEAAGLRQYLSVAKNRRVASLDEPLVDGDELALIPPVAGGSAVAVRSEALSVDEVMRLVIHPGAGGLVTFVGMVRREGAQLPRVERLEYEAYTTMAEERIQSIVSSLEAATPGVRVAIHHRVGKLAVGDIAVAIAVSAPHRAEAFAACREAIERLKKEVPIWKKEVGEDGEEWVGLGP
jgi:molybdopterin synthase catalytic subunit